MFFATLFSIIIFHVVIAIDRFDVAFEWSHINFTWPSAPKDYVPGTDVIAGIKIYKNIVYLALPRIKPTARITLASMPLGSNKSNPLLSPYPSWEMNLGSSCDTIQNVLSMEIDREGIMWVLDARRVDNSTDCPPKILLLDLNRNGDVVSNFIVPNELCPHRNGCFLNDLVVDGDHAYISDTTASDPGIMVYNRKSNRAWKLRDDKTMRGDPQSVKFIAQGVENLNLGHINGVALSPACPTEDGARIFYYMPQTSLHIYSISTKVLKNWTLSNSDISSFIKDEGTKQGQSGGMICDTDYNIYYGLLPFDSVGRWNTKTPLNQSIIVEQNHETIRWPDSFAIYQNYLYLITNSISKFSKYGIDNDDGIINFRIVKLLTNSKSYFYCTS